MRKRTDAAIIAAAKTAADQIDGDLNTHSAGLDCLADMLGNMGEMANQAKNGQAQTYFALSNSVRTIHAGVQETLGQVSRLRHGILAPPLPAWRGKAVRP